MEYKLILKGAEGVGKSALTIQLIKCHFVDEYDPTIEDSYRKQATIDNETCLLDILDTANLEGQNDAYNNYSAMSQSYYRLAEGFLYVYSQTSRSSFKELYKIIDSVLTIRKQQYADDEILQKPCGIIVGNKNDLVEECEVSTTEGEELARKYNLLFISTSAKVRNNIEEAFYYLVREIRKQKKAIADRDGKNNNNNKSCKNSK